MKRYYEYEVFEPKYYTIIETISFTDPKEDFFCKQPHSI